MRRRGAHAFAFIDMLIAVALLGGLLTVMIMAAGQQRRGLRSLDHRPVVCMW